jgi:alpha,alpha-trehalase
MQGAKSRAVLDAGSYDAAILDMDGVITRTARAHAIAWKKMFDDYLRERSEREGTDFVPFDDRKDYYRYVDGKPRYDGVRSFLESRGIELPLGTPEDPPEEETVCGLGNRKNRYFLEYIEEEGVEVYRSTIDFVEKMKELGAGVAVISSSRNARQVLQAAGVIEIFPVIVDGVDIAERDIAGKPAPDIFLEAAGELMVAPERAIVIEDAQSGVEAGRAGGFGMVIGIDRSGDNEGLRTSGAEIVVNDLIEIEIRSG